MPCPRPWGDPSKSATGSSGPVAQAQDDTVLIERGTSMRYLANSADPGLGSGWTANGFDDSSWTVGVYGIGYETSLPGATALIDTEP